MSLKLNRISRAYSGLPALNDVSIEVRQGEFLALLGPSGSGKTTLLRIMAGLDQPSQGSADLDGVDFLALSARERRVGMVFQSYALFRHMTVAQNIAFGLKVRPRKNRPDKAEINRRVEDLLRLVQLEGFSARFPSQLSGGQRQRVALARALAIEPSLLLLDEPFGALDARVRRDLRRWLRQVHEQTGVTTVLVTHDQEEALELADRVAILNKGKIEQIDTPQALYDRPASAFVHDFLGEGLCLATEVVAGTVSVAGWLGCAPKDAGDGPATLCLRPEDLIPSDAGLQATLIARNWRGHCLILEVEIEGQRIELERDGEEALARRLSDLAPGTPLYLRPRRYHILPSNRVERQVMAA
jgi:sulfate transport system ATP-binding protein